MKGATQHLLETKQQLKRAVAHASEMAAREFLQQVSCAHISKTGEAGGYGLLAGCQTLSKCLPSPLRVPAQSKAVMSNVGLNPLLLALALALMLPGRMGRRTPACRTLTSNPCRCSFAADTLLMRYAPLRQHSRSAAA